MCGRTMLDAPLCCSHPAVLGNFWKFCCVILHWTPQKSQPCMRGLLTSQAAGSPGPWGWWDMTQVPNSEAGSWSEPGLFPSCLYHEPGRWKRHDRGQSGRIVAEGLLRSDYTPRSSSNDSHPEHFNPTSSYKNYEGEHNLSKWTTWWGRRRAQGSREPAVDVPRSPTLPLPALWGLFSRGKAAEGAQLNPAHLTNSSVCPIKHQYLVLIQRTQDAWLRMVVHAYLQRHFDIKGC